jgi:hypothetical protein
MARMKVYLDQIAVVVTALILAAGCAAAYRGWGWLALVLGIVAGISASFAARLIVIATRTF